MYSLAKPQTIKICCVYTNSKNEIDGRVNNENISMLSKDDLIHFIATKNSYDDKPYLLQDVFHYNVNVKNHVDIDTSSFVKTGIDKIEDLNDSVVFFHDLNEIIILYKEKERRKRRVMIKTKKQIKPNKKLKKPTKRNL